MNVDNILFRCHSIGDIMGVKGLGDTGKKRAIYTYLEYKYGRRKQIKSKYLEKGTLCEPESFGIIKNVLGLDLSKNEERIDNEFLSGECDAISENCVVDLKNSWDIWTFHDSIIKYNTDYEWQLRCYMELYQKGESKLIYTLINAPDSMVLAALEKESYKYPEHDTPEWVEVEIIKDMVFTESAFDFLINARGLGGDELTDRAIETFIEIPEEERVFTFDFTADKEKYNQIVTRVKESRQFIKQRYKL